MIAGLHGKVEAIGTDWAIIDVGGISFQVYMPTSTLSTMGAIGEEVKLHTHLYLREDNATLYGVEKLTMAIVTGSTDLLTMIPGIGKKMADRLILELKEKIGAGMISAPAAQIAQENIDVIAALTSLGYSVAEASRAVATLPTSTDLSLEEKIKLALQYFGGK